MKKLIKIDYIVLGSAPNYTGERERWLWGHGLYHAGRRYKINIDPEELIANADNAPKLLELIKKAVQDPESTVKGTCYDIIMHRASSKNVRHSSKYQTFIIDDPEGGIMNVIDLGRFECPYCGWEAHTIEEFSHGWSIFCMTCGATSKRYDDPKEAAKDFLNGELLIKPHIEETFKKENEHEEDN